MIPRLLEKKMLQLMTQFPVISLTGPRQSGKSTLVKHTFPDYRYVSFEDPDVYETALDDPRSFLARYDNHVIFDEVQRIPSMFSYLQGIIDERDTVGQYVLSGSQNFLLLKSIPQSLAGRVAVLHLLPFSLEELESGNLTPKTIDEALFAGGYPRLNTRGISPSDFFPSYISTYVDRDVREELGVRKIAEFNDFLELAALRVGEVLNMESLANDCNVSVDTAKSWLSILESSFIAFRLRPYSKNYGKRITKASKLYFYDTGLAAHLLGIESSEQLISSNHRGNLFENLVVMEIIKRYEALGKRPKLYYWRDSNRKEIDLIIEKGGKPYYLIEVKSSTTFRPEAFSTIDSIAPEMGVPCERRFVVYGGSDSFENRHGRVIGLRDLGELVE